MEDGPAHVWWLVRRGEVWVVEVSGSNSAVLVMSSLAQLLVLLCRDVLLYTSHSEWERDRFSVYHSCGMDMLLLADCYKNVYTACTPVVCLHFHSCMCTIMHDHPYSTRAHIMYIPT